MSYFCNIQGYPTCQFFVSVPESRIIEKANTGLAVSNVTVLTPVSNSFTEIPQANSISISNVEVGGPKFRNVTDAGDNYLSISDVNVYSPVTSSATDNGNNSLAISDCFVYQAVSNNFSEPDPINQIAITSVNVI